MVMKKHTLALIIFIGLATIVGVLLLFLERTPSPPRSEQQLQKTYVVMGDSVAAGVGLDDSSDSSACNRTKQAYPNEVASSLGLELTNLACTGASSQVGILGPQDVNGLATTQIDQLFELKKPDLITLTVGANDINWTSIISKCYMETCGDAADIAQTTAGILGVGTSIADILERIKSNYENSPPVVIVTGYYQVFPAGDTSCASLRGVAAAEREWWRSQEDRLNSTIRDTVGRYPFARFAPVDFNNHELCSDNSWVQGFRDTAPFHPTKDGQKAITASVVDTYNKR